jgi:hypothetical protein
MSLLTVRHGVAALALAALWTTPAEAARYDLAYPLCIPDLALLPELIDRVRIVPGCEVIDCCPGCPGAERLDWVIRFDDGLIEEVTLRLDGFAPEELEGLRIEGQGARDGATVTLRGGRAVLRGVPARFKDRPPPVGVGTRLGGAASKALQDLDAADAGPPSGPIHGVSVDQVLGKVVVNSHRVRFDLGSLEWCPRLPTTPTKVPSDKLELLNNLVHDHTTCCASGWRSGAR